MPTTMPGALLRLSTRFSRICLMSVPFGWKSWLKTKVVANRLIKRAALKTHALQTLARGLQAHGSREAFGVRASSAPLLLPTMLRDRFIIQDHLIDLLGSWFTSGCPFRPTLARVIVMR